MKVSDLIEAKDLVDHATGLNSITTAQREVLETAAEILGGVIPCETCSGRGWVIQKADKNGMVMVLACKSCGVINDHREAGDEALLTLKDFLEGADVDVD